MNLCCLVSVARRHGKVVSRKAPAGADSVRGAGGLVLWVSVAVFRSRLAGLFVQGVSIVFKISFPFTVLFGICFQISYMTSPFFFVSDFFWKKVTAYIYIYFLLFTTMTVSLP